MGWFGAAAPALTMTTAVAGDGFRASKSGHFDLGDADTDSGFWYELRQDDQRDWFTRFTEPGSEVARSTFRFNRSFDDLRLEWGSPMRNINDWTRQGFT